MANLILSASFWETMPGWLSTTLLALFRLLDHIVYLFINWVYRVFILISEVDIFKDGTQFEEITKRLYVIVGIAMLFIFAYNLVLLIINPEGKQVGNMAKVVQNAIISMILIIFLPMIFTWTKTIQNHIVTQNVIPNIIFGTSVDSDEQKFKTQNAGVQVSLDIYSAFFHPNEKTIMSCRNECPNNQCNNDICLKYITAYDEAYDSSDISKFIWNKELTKGIKDGEFEYLFILSTIAGGLALWMFVSFALDIGIRVGKLAFYEVISPIPVMMRILPNDKMFDKWFKGFTQAYISIFIRLLIIYFCVFAVTLVPTIMSGLTVSGDNGLIVALATVVVILGILQFAKDAPKLISDLFGGGGDVKFGIKDKYKPLTGAIRGGVYGATTGEGWGRVSGFFRGAGKGATKGYDAAVSSVDGLRDAKNDGSTFGGRTLDRLRTGIGMRTRYDSIGSDVEKQMKKEKIEKRREHNKMVSDSISTLKDKAGSVVTDKDSKYLSTGNYYAVSDMNSHKTYDLNGKNYYEMKAVLDQAIRDNAAASTVTALERSIAQFEKDTKDVVIDDVLKNNTANIQGRYLTSMQNAVQDLQEQVAEGAAETIDATTGKLVSGIKDSTGNIISSISDVTQLKDADKAVKASNRDIDIQERNIKKQDAKFKAKKADRDYIKNSGNKSGK